MSKVYVKINDFLEGFNYPFETAEKLTNICNLHYPLVDALLFSDHSSMRITPKDIYVCYRNKETQKCTEMLHFSSYHDAIVVESNPEYANPSDYLLQALSFLECAIPVINVYDHIVFGHIGYEPAIHYHCLCDACMETEHDDFENTVFYNGLSFLGSFITDPKIQRLHAAFRAQRDSLYEKTPDSQVINFPPYEKVDSKTDKDSSVVEKMENLTLEMKKAINENAPYRVYPKLPPVYIHLQGYSSNNYYKKIPAIDPCSHIGKNSCRICSVCKHCQSCSCNKKESNDPRMNIIPGLSVDDLINAASSSPFFGGSSSEPTKSLEEQSTIHVLGGITSLHSSEIIGGYETTLENQVKENVNEKVKEAMNVNEKEVRDAKVTIPKLGQLLKVCHFFSNPEPLLPFQISGDFAAFWSIDHITLRYCKKTIVDEFVQGSCFFLTASRLYTYCKGTIYSYYIAYNEVKESIGIVQDCKWDIKKKDVYHFILRTANGFVLASRGGFILFFSTIPLVQDRLFYSKEISCVHQRGNDVVFGDYVGSIHVVKETEMSVTNEFLSVSHQPLTCVFIENDNIIHATSFNHRYVIKNNKTTSLLNLIGADQVFIYENVQITKKGCLLSICYDTKDCMMALNKNVSFIVDAESIHFLMDNKIYSFTHKVIHRVLYNQILD